MHTGRHSVCYGEKGSLMTGRKLALLRRLLHTLRVRYTLDMIYTYSGNILIAVGSAHSSGHAIACLPCTLRTHASLTCR